MTASVHLYSKQEVPRKRHLLNAILAAIVTAFGALVAIKWHQEWMAVTAFWYGTPLMNQWGTTAANQVQWTADTIKMALTTSTYAPSQDADDFFNDVTNELAGSGGYTTGGVTLSSKTLTYDGPTNTVRLKAADVTWTALTPSGGIRYAVIYKSTGTGSTSPLMGYVNMGADQSPAGVDFTVKGDPNDGFLRIVAS